MRHAHPLPLGAELLSESTSRFRIWAPACKGMSLEIPGQPLLPMARGADGVFSRTVHCGAGTSYQFVTDTGLRVPDPLSRAQVCDAEGPSMVVDPGAYHWRHAAWRGRPWKEMVIYELHVGCFDGGRFRNVTERLGTLQRLGVTAIQLMPIADFAGKRNWGYDGVLPFAPDRAYGTPDDLKQLIDTAHGLGLCVYLDVVYNHFGPRGNFLHQYAPSFFLPDSDSPWGAAIDFSQHHVQQFYIENALYWLQEYRFDGLRFDAVHAIQERDFLILLAARVRAAIDPERRVHLMLENEDNDAALLNPGHYDAQWNDDAHNALHVLLTGESEGYYAPYTDAPTARLARCLGEGFAWQGEPFPGYQGAPRGTPSSSLPPTAFIFFLQNHDQIGNRALGERLTTLTDLQRLRAAVTLQLLCPQIPLLFMGEEWGAQTPFLFFTDFDGELADAVREGRRQEFSDFSAFAHADQRRQIPDPNDEASWKQSCLIYPDLEGETEASSYWRFYHSLLHLRQTYLVPHLEGCRSLGTEVLSEGALAAHWQLGNRSVLSMFANLASKPIQADLPSGDCLFVSQVTESLENGTLPPVTTMVWLQ